MIYLPDTNACITLLRGKEPTLIARWQATKVSDMALSAVVVYELRYGAERAADPAKEHAKLDAFLSPFSPLPFDDSCSRWCARLRWMLERNGTPIGPHDLQIAATAMAHNLILITHNTREFGRIVRLQLEDWEI
jgi:tRNA(fMet)-specific endonuclease VapC